MVREQVGAATPERCRHALLVVHLRWQLEFAGTVADVGAHGVIDAPRKDRDPGVTAEARRGCDRGQYACALTSDDGCAWYGQVYRATPKFVGGVRRDGRQGGRGWRLKYFAFEVSRGWCCAAY